jgi:hypothetical protein
VQARAGNPEALRTAKRVWLATDCDREGQLIGQEILEHSDNFEVGQRRGPPPGRPDLQPVTHPHSWSDGWLQKLKDDLRLVKGDLAVIGI